MKIIFISSLLIIPILVSSCGGATLPPSEIEKDQEDVNEAVVSDSISVDSSKDTLGIKGKVKDVVKKAKAMTKEIEIPTRDDAYKAYNNVKKAVKIKKDAEKLYDNIKVW